MAHSSVGSPEKNPGTVRLVAQCLNHCATPGLVYIYKFVCACVSVVCVCVCMEMVFICTVRRMAKGVSFAWSLFNSYNDLYSRLRW